MRHCFTCTAVILSFMLGLGSANAQLFSKRTSGPVVARTNFSTSGSWGDLDGDGDQDLFVTNWDASFNELFVNDGKGAFLEVTDDIAVRELANATSGRWVDFDRDLDLDLFVTNLAGGNFLYRNERGFFARITTDILVLDPGSFRVSSWADYDSDGTLDLVVTQRFDQNNALYRNHYGKFLKIEDVPITSDGGNSTCACWGDYDDDGDVDLFVGNTDNQNNFLYENKGRAFGFERVTRSVVVNDSGRTASCAWVDYDNDGDLDLFIANVGGQNNVLYTNDGTGQFSKVTEGVLVNDGGDSNGSTWADFDNDGDLDVFISNRAGENNSLYLNNGDGGFVKVENDVAVNDGGNSLTASYADMDRDGDLDLFVANNGEPNFLYENLGTGHNWIILRLRGTRSNTQAIGAKVRLKATIGGRSIWQMRHVVGGSDNSQSSYEVHFGLGEAARIDSIVVEWPSGLEEYVVDVSANQVGEFLEGQVTGVASTDQAVPNQFVLHQNYPNPFNPTTTIEFTLPQGEFVTLTVYDLLGREVETLVARRLGAGTHRVTWDARGLTSGLYVYELRAGAFTARKKLMLLK